MSQTLSSELGTITPERITGAGYAWAWDSGTIEHRLSNGGAAYVLRDGGPLKNRIEMEFPTAAEAFAARSLLRTPTVWSWADSEVPESNMDVVVVGQPSLSPLGGGYWLLVVPISEVEGSGS